MKVTFTVGAVFDLSQALIYRAFRQMRSKPCRCAASADQAEKGCANGYLRGHMRKDGTSFPVEVRGAVACVRLFSPETA
jgi:hypothetical protein